MMFLDEDRSGNSSFYPLLMVESGIDELDPPVLYS